MICKKNENYYHKSKRSVELIETITTLNLDKGKTDENQRRKATGAKVLKALCQPVTERSGRVIVFNEPPFR
jgi:hypothetical protein